jgi:hypothetical protein
MRWIHIAELSGRHSPNALKNRFLTRDRTSENGAFLEELCADFTNVNADS